MTRMEGIRANAQWLVNTPPGSSEEKQMAIMLKARLIRVSLTDDADEAGLAFASLIADPTPWDQRP